MDGFKYTYSVDTGNDIVINRTKDPYDSNRCIDGNNVKDIIRRDATLILLKKDGTLSYIDGGSHVISLVDKEYGRNVKECFTTAYGLGILLNNGDVYGWDYTFRTWGFVSSNKDWLNGLEKINLPEELSGGKIKEVFTSERANYFLANDGTLFFIGDTDELIGPDEGLAGVNFLKCTNTPKIYSFKNFSEKIRNCSMAIQGSGGLLVFETLDEKILCDGSIDVVYRNEILKNNWVHIASSVVDIALQTSKLALVVKDKDGNQNLYTASEDSLLSGRWVSSEYDKNLALVSDANVKDKVSKVYFNKGQLYVLTKDKKLFGVGISGETSVNWPNFLYPGWEAETNGKYEDKTNFTLIAENVDLFSNDLGSPYARDHLMLQSGGLKGWGENFWGACGYGRGTAIPTNISVNLGEKSYNDITGLWCNFECCCFTLDDGSIWINGGHWTGAANQQPIQRASSDKFENCSSYVDNKKVIDVSYLGTSALYILTEDGCVYGYGSEKYLGSGLTDNTRNGNISKLPIDNVKSITCGNGFAICVKKDGTVWGIGDNSYGSLGRWSGAPRDSSRYRSTYYWVRCPELEN